MTSEIRPVLFIRSDGSWTTAMLLLVIGVPLAFPFGLAYSLIVFLTALLLATCNAVQDIKEEDKQEIRYNILHADDILLEIRQAEQVVDKVQTARNQRDKKQHEARLVVEAGMAALVKKYARQQQQARASLSNDVVDDDDDCNHLPILCQEAAYIALRLFPRDDTVIAPAISLLSLVAKNKAVRKQHMSQPDYTVDIPIQALRQALLQAQDRTSTSDDGVDQTAEQNSAELQRKGCLLLGALSDGHVDLAKRIVEFGGLEAVVEAITWFQYHAEVVNWGLWAAFQLCFEHMVHKCRFVSLGGVPLVVNAMRNCSEDTLVARHGIALLFDFMREPDVSEDLRLDVWKVRNQALDAGLHEAVVAVMAFHSGTMDIMMMGSEILAGTDYRGIIPQFNPVAAAAQEGLAD